MFMPPSLETISTGSGRGPIDDDAQVQLAGDVAAFFDQHLAHDLPVGPGLDRHQLLAEQVAGDRAGLVGALDQLHAVLLGVVLDGSLAASAGMDLRLDDRDLAAQLRKAAAASSAVRATMPRGTATPALRRISLAWYSWIFMRLVSLSGRVAMQRLPRASNVSPRL